MSIFAFIIFLILLFGNLATAIYWAAYLEEHKDETYTIQSVLCKKCNKNNINIWGKIVICILITPFSVLQLAALVILILFFIITDFAKKLFFKLFQNKD